MSKPTPPNYVGWSEVGKIPVIGPWIARIGKVYDIWATPCNTTPGIWALAAWHALPRIFVLFTTPFLLADQWKFRTGSGRHGKKKVRISFDVEVEADNFDPGVVGWKFFKLTAEIALRLEWYFFVADVVTEAALNWSSLVYAYAGCRFPGDLWCEGNGFFPKLHQCSPDGQQCYCAPGGVTGNMPCDEAGPTISPGQAGAFAFSFGWESSAGIFPGPAAKSVQFEVRAASLRFPIGGIASDLNINGKGQAELFLPFDGSVGEITTLSVWAVGEAAFYLWTSLHWSFNGFDSGTRGLDSVLPQH